MSIDNFCFIVDNAQGLRNWVNSRPNISPEQFEKQINDFNNHFSTLFSDSSDDHN